MQSLKLAPVIAPNETPKRRPTLSAVASAIDVPAVPALQVVEHHESTPEFSDAEMYRWMLWFGLPMLIAAVFLGALFATGQAWLIAPVIAFLVGDIFVLVWLCMSSDTNGLIGSAPAH
jgi:hypothetical protein